MWAKLSLAFRYLFYRGYIHQLSRWYGNERVAAFASVCMLALLIFFNLFSLWTIVLFVTKIKIPDNFGLPYVGSVAALICVAVFGFVYLREDRYKNIAKEFSTEKGIDKRRRTTYIWIYVVCTALMWLLSLAME